MEVPQVLVKGSWEPPKLRSELELYRIRHPPRMEIWTEPGWQEHWVPMVELESGEGWVQGSESCELEDPHA